MANPSAAPVIGMAIFVLVFAVASLRGVHLGILMFVAACVTGMAVAEMPLREVVAGFPIGILVLVAGVTYFFGIAQLNGTVDRLIRGLLRHTGGRPAAVPLVFFLLSAVASAMGSPQAGLVTAPIGMPAGRRAGVDPVLMAIAINSGISAGGFAPTSLFGIVTYRVARQAQIDVSQLTLLTAALIANLVLLAAALIIFGRWSAATTDQARAATASTAGPGPEAGVGVAQSLRQQPHQVATIVCIGGLILTIIVCAFWGVEPDIGVAALGLGAVLVLIDPAIGPRAFARIDWSTAFVVGGIVTFVGVLQKLGAVNLLGQTAMEVGTPVVAAVVVCAIAALVSAFASTTGVLAALVPMAVPLASSGGIEGWALITALGVSATVVDASPFSNTGATLIASAADDDRPRLRTMLMRWGLALVIVGPVVLVPLLALISR